MAQWMPAQQECSLLLLMRSFSGLLSPGPVLPALLPSPSLPSATPPPCSLRQDSNGGEHQSSVLSPRLPLASRVVDTALVGRSNSHLPLPLAVVSIGGMRAGYINTSSTLAWKNCLSYPFVTNGRSFANNSVFAMIFQF